MDRIEIKRRAREQIKGNLLMLFVVNILIALVYGLGSATIVLPLILGGPINLGLVYIARNLYNGKGVEVETLFEGFKNFGKSFALFIIQSLFLFLWSLLFFIPGLIKTYSYSMSFYILADNPDMSATDAITESRRMMDGYKFKLFVQHLSFLGWLLLSVLTLHILAFVWVIPYMTQADYNFYLALKNERNINYTNEDKAI